MNLKIISSSIRSGRKSHNVALYIQNWVHANSEHAIDIIDLKALNFPLFDERLKHIENPSEKVIQFSEDIEKSDALFIVTPEYNGSFPASLKNVVDLLFKEWDEKPICLAPVSGGIFAGTQVTKDLGFMMYRLGSHLTKARFHVGEVGKNFNDKGEAINNIDFYHMIMEQCIIELEDTFKDITR